MLMQKYFEFAVESLCWHVEKLICSFCLVFFFLPRSLSARVTLLVSLSGQADVDIGAGKRLHVLWC